MALSKLYNMTTILVILLFAQFIATCQLYSKVKFLETLIRSVYHRIEVDHQLKKSMENDKGRKAMNDLNRIINGTYEKN